MRILVTTDGSRVVWRSTPQQHKRLVELLDALLPDSCDAVVTIIMTDRIVGRPRLVIRSRRTTNIETAINGRRS